MQKSRKSEYPNPANYYRKKGYYAIPMQAVCDSRYPFTFFSGKCIGPTHGSIAFSLSLFNEKICTEGLPRAYWIAADDVYVRDKHIITPVSAAKVRSMAGEDGFDF